MDENWTHIFRERAARYVVDTQGQPIAVLLTIAEYKHYRDLLDDKVDSQDDELAKRLAQATTPSPDGERQTFHDYICRRKASHADQVQS
jgi:hypothetical protein